MKALDTLELDKAKQMFAELQIQRIFPLMDEVGVREPTGSTF